MLTATRNNLIANGYAVLPGIFDAALIARLRPLASRLLDGVSEDEQRARRSTGSLQSLWLDPGFAELIAWQPMWQAMRDLGFPDARFSNGYVVSKPSLTPRTFWHHDWWGWDDAASYTSFVHQIGCIFYFDATNRDNGALRVIPGSHRRRHRLHKPTNDESNKALRRYDDPSAEEFGDATGEVDVPANAGDMVLVDARLLHATHANIHPQRRTAALCWVVPDLAGWSQALRERHPRHGTPIDWPAAARALVEPRIIHDGAPGRIPIPYGMFPGDTLL